MDRGVSTPGQAFATRPRDLSERPVCHCEGQLGESSTCLTADSRTPISQYPLICTIEFMSSILKVSLRATTMIRAHFANPRSNPSPPSALCE